MISDRFPAMHNTSRLPSTPAHGSQKYLQVAIGKFRIHIV